MLVSHKYRFVFIHTPKCGGNTVRALLSPYCEMARPARGWRWDHGMGRYVDDPHTPLLELAQTPEFSELKHYFWFTFVRDPYTRFASALSEHFAQHNLRDTVDPIAFSRALDPARIRHDVALTHFCPMHAFTHIGLKRHVDEVLRIEDFDRDFHWLAATLNLPRSAFSAHYPREYMRADTPYKLDFSSYADSLAPIVERLYDRDFSLFGYQKRSTPAFNVLQAGAASDAAPRYDEADVIGGLTDSPGPARFEALSRMLEELDALRSRIVALEQDAATSAANAKPETAASVPPPECAAVASDDPSVRAAAEGVAAGVKTASDEEA